jgi:hypothetical protein
VRSAPTNSTKTRFRQKKQRPRGFVLLSAFGFEGMAKVVETKKTRFLFCAKFGT